VRDKFSNFLCKKQKQCSVEADLVYQHLKEIGWAFFLILFWLGCLVLIFGRIIEFQPVFWVCLGLAGIVAVIFSMLLLGEMIFFGSLKLIGYFLSKKTLSLPM
jgi:hypothetical protein